MPPAGKRIKGTAYERADARERLRTELLTAARAIACETNGFESVTVRTVSDRVGYAAPIVYEHFANKRALLVELVGLGFTELAERLGHARCPQVYEREGGPVPAVAAAYWDFAMNDPHLYRLMHTLPSVPFGTADVPARACFEALRSAIAAGAPQLQAYAHDDDAAADLLWADLHGLVSLVLDGRIKGGARRGRELLTDLTTTLVRSTGKPAARTAMLDSSSWADP